MKAIAFIKLRRNYIFYILLCFLIGAAGLFWAFDFGFIAEDWWELWVISNPKLHYLVFQTDLFANHPIETFHQIILLHFFGYNSYFWEIFAYFSKVLNAFAVALAVWGITNSKKAALYSSLIFAASVGGLESYYWVGRWSPALILFLLAIGLYFWVKSFSEKIISKKYIIACFLFLLAIFGEPGRGIVVFASCLIWDIIAVKKYSKKTVSKIILRNCLLIFISLSLLLTLWKNHVFNSTTNNYQEWTGYMISHPLETSKNFLTSIGNFVAGGFVLTYDSQSMSHSDEASLTYGVIFLFISIYFFTVALKRKTPYAKQMLFFCLWIPVAFFPSWFVVHYFYAPPLVAGVTHHYFAISALGLSAATGYFLSRFSKEEGIILLVVVIISNIAQSNRILQQEWNHRSARISNMVWDKIDREVPADVDNNSIFFFTGYDPLASDLDASDAIPLAIKRDITDLKNMPIQTIVGMENLEKFFCEEGVFYYTAVREKAYTKKKIPLSRFYIWEVKNNVFSNISAQERKKWASSLKCNFVP